MQLCFSLTVYIVAPPTVSNVLCLNNSPTFAFSHIQTSRRRTYITQLFPSGSLGEKRYHSAEHFAHAFPDSSHTQSCLGVSDLCQVHRPPRPLQTQLLSSPSQGPPVWTAAAKLAASLVENIRHTWRALVVASLPERKRRKEREKERRVERYRECVWVALFPALWTHVCLPPLSPSPCTHIPGFIGLIPCSMAPI